MEIAIILEKNAFFFFQKCAQDKEREFFLATVAAAFSQFSPFLLVPRELLQELKKYNR